MKYLLVFGVYSIYRISLCEQFLDKALSAAPCRRAAFPWHVRDVLDRARQSVLASGQVSLIVAVS